VRRLDRIHVTFAGQNIGVTQVAERTFDRLPVTGQNGLVRRSMLLAMGVSALLWTVTARTGSVPPDDIITMSGVGSCLLTGNSHGPGDSDQHWRAQHHTIAAVTESVWKSALVHAELAATPSARAFDTARAASSPGPPVRSAPHYLRHTPLLI
jgi:hypothetical protein